MSLILFMAASALALRWFWVWRQGNLARAERAFIGPHFSAADRLPPAGVSVMVWQPGLLSPVVACRPTRRITDEWVLGPEGGPGERRIPVENSLWQPLDLTLKLYWEERLHGSDNGGPIVFKAWYLLPIGCRPELRQHAAIGSVKILGDGNYHTYVQLLEEIGYYSTPEAAKAAVLEALGVNA